MTPKISIIIPVYNSEMFLIDCLSSVTSQTYTNLEIICIDDGSTDGSAAILESYAQKDSRIIVIHKENGGVSSARNAGLDIATGEYIGFVDSDDYCLPNMYEVMLCELQRMQLDATICAFVDREKKLAEGAIVFSGEEAISEMNDGRLYMGHLHNKLLSRTLIGDLHFDEDIAILEDLLFLNRVLINAKKVGYIDRGLYFYRINEESALNNKFFKKSYLSRIEACHRIECFYYEKGISNNMCIKKLKFNTYYTIIKKIVVAPNRTEYVDELKDVLKNYRICYDKTFIRNMETHDKILHITMKYNMPLFYLIIFSKRLRMIIVKH